jgi:hypothetical protein
MSIRIVSFQVFWNFEVTIPPDTVTSWPELLPDLVVQRRALQTSVVQNDLPLLTAGILLGEFVGSEVGILL